ncbi:copper homeostasis protein CutC [Luedemannella flava]|uniref:PF03932 family protein CutC n=1 Tax=Luedemannella flava TaxID=349316 RepID=A0ABN2LSN2_9ACTN
MTALEIAVTSAQGARTAYRCGADRVELCAALEVGGLTPSAGLLDTTLAGLEALTSEPGRPWQGVHVLIRPRPGDFVYDADDLATAAAEVRAACRAGAQGVVVGALTAGGAIDPAALRLLAGTARQSAPQVAVTFHRAFDQTASLPHALAELLDLGLVDRVLTSGGRATAGQAADVLASLAGRSAGRIEIMAGGGVRLDDIPALTAAGVDAVHLSAKRRVAGAGARVALGAGDDDPGAYFVTDAGQVSKAAAALGAAGRPGG